MLTACGTDVTPAASYVTDCTIAEADVPAARTALIAARTPGCEAGCPTEEEVLELLVAAAPGCSSIRVVAGEGEAGGVPRVPSTGTRAGTAAGATAAATTPQTAQPPVAVYIESSGSMYAYLKGPSDLKNRLREVMQALRSPLAPVAGQLTTGYLQQEAKPFAGDPMAFAGSLTKQNLQNAASGSSNISQLVERTLDQAGDGVAVLISDFVFSPGKGQDADAYLTQQRLALQQLTETRLAADERFAVALVAVDAADFDGPYYDHNNKPTPYAGPRPYYYFVGGRNPGVRAVAEAIETATGGTAITFAKGGARVDYAVPEAQKALGLGTYDVSGAPGNVVLTDPEAARGGGQRGLLRVPVAVDLGSLALTEAQLRDASAVRVTNPWTVSAVEPISGQPPYTHRLSLDYRGDPYPGEVTVGFPSGTTGALEQRYFAAGTNDEGDPAAFAGKTYGLRELVQGIAAAYAKTSPPATPAGSFTFKIEK